MKIARRNDGHTGGKYALVRLRDVQQSPDAERALNTLLFGGFVDMEKPGDKDEFFAVKLRDVYAAAALYAYAAAAEADDPEYAAHVRELAARAGVNSPHRKRPD